MPEDFHLEAQRVADEIISLSAAFEARMEKWSDTDSRPDNMDITECVGFINKDNSEKINIVADLWAPAGNSKAVLRTWAIETRLDANNSERFDNIQLKFSVNHDKARAVARLGSEITRDDLRELLKLDDTALVQAIVSDETGEDDATGQSLGQRYDLEGAELNQLSENAGDVVAAMHSILSRLKHSVKL